MIKLSAVVITYNEEVKIGACLDSVLPVADETVVVDSLSTDRTREICLARSVRFLEHPFRGYVEQVRWAVAQASHPYVLSLDADERLSPGLAASIVRAKARWEYDGYRMNRRNHYGGRWIRHGGWYPDRKLRLWDTRKGRYGGTNPHYRVEMDPAGRVGLLSGDILHFSHDSVRGHLSQARRFSDLAARELRQSGKGGILFALATHPAFRFFRTYFLQGGFLDGLDGLCISAVASYEVFLKYAKASGLIRPGADKDRSA